MRSNPSPAYKKRVALVQYEDRNDRLLLELIARNATYCERHGYQHIFIQRVSEDIPPWWVKVFVLKEVIKQDFDIVAWLDSDAVVHDQDRELHSFFSGKESMIFASDPPAWNNQSPFNAGVMIFRSGVRAQKIIEEWVDQFSLNKWKKQGGEWHTDGEWAGENYEQGAFVKKVLPACRTEELLKEVDWQVLQSPWLTSESFTLHFANRTRPNAVLYLNLLEKYRITEGIKIEKNSS